MAQVPSSRVINLILLTLTVVFGLAAGASAQSGDETVVTITEVQSRDYPRVSVFLAVADKNGPIDDLDKGDFQIFEDNAKTSITPISVESASLDGLRLVLALDTSMPENELDEIKSAATNFINSMTPKDRAAIIIFGDEADLAHDFTNNTTELKAVIDDLTPQGNQTAIHEAIIEATELLAEIPEGQQAAIFLTDSRDNTGKQSVTQAVSQAQEDTLPVYVAGFGEKVQPAHPLKEEVALTGGRYFTLANVDEVQPAIEEIEMLLRKGYHLTFQSEFTADNAEHDMTIIITHSNGKGQAESSFVAAPGTVIVKAPGIVADEMLASKVSLSPEITAPTTLGTVTYLLDDEVLATFTEPPYSFEWDTSNVKAGSYTLVIKAVDNVGNEGQAEIPVTVAAPVTVEISSTKQEVEIGKPVAFQTMITATAQVAAVDLLLNNELLESITEPPYRFTFDSSDYPTGNYLFVVRVEDSLGQTAQDSLSLNFVPPPPPPLPLWQRIWNDQRLWSSIIIVLATVAFVAIGFIAILVLLLIDSSHRKRSRQRCSLEIVNTGNIQSRYRLRAKDAENVLQFEFSMGKSILPPLMVAQPTPVTAAPAGVMPMVASSSTQAQTFAQQTPAQGSPPAQQKQGGGPGGAKQAMAKAGSVQSQAYGCSYAITEILNTVGSLLPGSAGASVRKVSGQVQRGQATADRAVRAPTQTARSAQYLQSQVADAVPAGSKGSTSTGSSGYTPAGTGTAPGAFPQTSSAGVGQVSTGGSPALQPRSGYVNTPATNGYQKVVDSTWSQTPFVEPGNLLTIDLLIMPDKPFKKHSYDFTLSSKPIDYDDTPVNEQGTAQIKGVFWLWRYISIFTIVLIMAILMFGVLWVAFWRLFAINLPDYINFAWIWLSGIS